MILVIILFSILTAYLCSIVWSRRKFYKLHSKLENNLWCLPILGNILYFVGDNEARMNALKRFGRISIQNNGLTSLWLGPKFCILVSDAEVAEIVLKTYLSKSSSTNISYDLFGNGSIFAPVDIWRPRRKVMAPTFSTKNLNQFVEIFDRGSRIMVKQLETAAGRGVFSIWNYLATYTLDSVGRSTLGVNINSQHQATHPFLKVCQSIFEIDSFRLLWPPMAQKLYEYVPRHKQVLEKVHFLWNFIDNIVKDKRMESLGNCEKINQCKTNNLNESTQLKTFLELMIESSGGASGFTDLELREEALVLVLAGTDTSAVGAGYTCLMLARHPGVQETLYHEIKSVLGESDRPITMADLPELKYLEAVIKETLRLYPPVPLIAREADKDFQLPSGLTIVKGTEMMINIWAVHRNPRYWGEDAELFRPERHIGATIANSAAFIGFSNGPRACLGYKYAMMSMKTAIASLVRHYRILPASPIQDKDEPVRVKFEVMMKPVDNFQLQLELRNNLN